MKWLITAFLLSYASFNVAQAADSDNDCSSLHIQISNLTKEACILTSQNVIHGNLITPPPLSILPNDSKRFDMMQTGYGPSIRLSYQCGADIITFTSQQNYCFLEAGDITGTITHPLSDNVTASYKAIIGSYFWGMSGSINWELISFR